MALAQVSRAIETTSAPHVPFRNSSKAGLRKSVGVVVCACEIEDDIVVEPLTGFHKRGKLNSNASMSG